MKLTLDKDAVTLLNTEIATLGIWDSQGASWIDSDDAYLDMINHLTEDNESRLDGVAILFSTEADGQYQITLRRNKGLTTAEKKILYKKALGNPFTVTSQVYLGDPGEMGYNENFALEHGLLDEVKLAPGDYIIDAYSVLTLDEADQPQYLQYILCIFDKGTYPGSKVNKGGTILNLKYSIYTPEQEAAAKTKAREASKRLEQETRALLENTDVLKGQLEHHLVPTILQAAPKMWKSIDLEILFQRQSMETHINVTLKNDKTEYMQPPFEIYDSLRSIDGEHIDPSYVLKRLSVHITRGNIFSKPKSNIVFEPV